MGAAALVGFAVGTLWSYAVGFAIAASLALIGLELHLRWDKARWIKRFPEAATSGAWRRRYGISSRL